MIANIKSVLVGLTKQSGTDEGSSALAYGLSLAQAADAHLTVQAASVKLVLTNAWVSGFATRLVGAENRRLHALAEAVARTARSEASAAGVVCTTESPHLAYPDLLASFAAQARVHDLTILDAEPKATALDRGLIEAVLMDSGRPIIIVPNDQSRFESRRVIVAWDGSGTAARAVADALPCLRAADAVEIVSVSGEKALPDSVMGVDLARHLARHGVPVSVKTLTALNGDVAETFRNEAALLEADVIVMGGFMHSRLREFVLGGVTRDLLKDSSVPLFMSH